MKAKVRRSSLLASVSESAIDSDRDVQIAVGLFDSLQTEVDNALQRHVDALEQEHSWALLQAMYERTTKHGASCIVLLANGHFSSTEALCRTAIESSVNLYYCSLGDSMERILSYFKAYISTERKQNLSWRSTVLESTASQDEKQRHLKLIESKDAVLTHQERVLEEAFSQAGYSYAKAVNSWPSIFERFRDIGKEIHYRTVYAALCSQAHNDPEDLLNDFVHCVTQMTEASEAQENENQNFARYMVLVALVFLIESTMVYLAKFLSDTNERLLPLLHAARDAVEIITQRSAATATSSVAVNAPIH